MTKQEPPTNGLSASKLTAYLDRIDNVEDEIAALNGDRQEIWAEAKAAGFNVKWLRKAHALRKLDAESRMELALYVDALKLFED